MALASIHEAYHERRRIYALVGYCASVAAFGCTSLVLTLLDIERIWLSAFHLLPFFLLATAGVIGLLGVRVSESFRWLVGERISAGAALPCAFLSQVLAQIVAEGAQYGSLGVLCGELTLLAFLHEGFRSTGGALRLPLPLALGVVLGAAALLGHILSVFIPDSPLGVNCEGLLLRPLALLVSGAAAQLPWGAYAELLEKQQYPTPVMRDPVKQAWPSKPASAGSGVYSINIVPASPDRSAPNRSPVRCTSGLSSNVDVTQDVAGKVWGHTTTENSFGAFSDTDHFGITQYDALMAEMDGIWGRLSDIVPDDVMEMVGAVLSKVKVSLLSNNLFKSDLNAVPDIWRRNQHDPTVQAFQEFLNDDNVMVVREKGEARPSAEDKASPADRPSPMRQTSNQSSEPPSPKQYYQRATTGIPCSPYCSELGDPEHQKEMGLGLDELFGCIEPNFLSPRNPSTQGRVRKSGIMSSISLEDLSSLKLGSWGFDAHGLQAKTGHALVAAGMRFGPSLVAEAGLGGQSTKLQAFLFELEAKYRDVPYHNSVHAADVLNSTMFLLRQDKATSHWPLGPVPRLAGFIAAAGHDAGHFGRNNRYHVMRHHSVAVLFNDNAPLENMHCAITFFLLDRPDASFLLDGAETRTVARRTSGSSAASGEQPAKGLSDQDYTQMRKLIVEAILSTDMAKHVETTARFRAVTGFVENYQAGASFGCKADAEIGTEKPNERDSKVTSIYLKAADLGHGSKPLHITREFTLRIHQEFFSQGEAEKEHGLPISPLCDRSATVISKSQAGFLQHLVMPLYELVHHYIPSEEMQEEIMKQLSENASHWESPNPCLRVEDI